MIMILNKTTFLKHHLDSMAQIRHTVPAGFSFLPWFQGTNGDHPENMDNASGDLAQLGVRQKRQVFIL